MSPKLVRRFINAVCNKDLELVKKLLAEDPSIINQKANNNPGLGHKKAIYYTLRHLNSEMFDFLIKNGATIDQSDLLTFIKEDIYINYEKSYEFLTSIINISSITNYNKEELKDALFNRVLRSGSLNLVEYVYNKSGLSLDKIQIVLEKHSKSESPFIKTLNREYKLSNII